MVKRLQLSVCLMLTLTGAAADELQLRPGMTGVADLGATSCETFTAMYPNGPTGMRQAVLYFAEGYVYARTGTSLSAVLAAQSQGWDFESLTDVVVEYCAGHPDDTVQAGVDALWERMSR